MVDDPAMPVMRNRKTWMLVLRCYACGGKFTQRHLSFDKVSALPLILPCPYCTARPRRRAEQGTGASEPFEIHHVIDLEDETETYYRKEPDAETWHFAAGCSHWPSDDFIELDGHPIRGELCNECRALATESEKPET